MGISLDRLDLLRRETAVRRQEVSELQRRLLQRIEHQKRLLIKKSGEMRSFKETALEVRHRLKPKEIFPLIKNARTKKQVLVSGEKELKQLELHSQKLSQQFSFFKRKTDILKQKEITEKLHLQENQLELEGEVLTEQALFRKDLSIDRESRESIETQSEESLYAGEFASEEKAAEVYSQRESSSGLSISDNSADEHNNRGYSELSEEQVSSSIESNDSMEELTESEQTEYWSEGEEHHLHFTFNFSDNHSVRIQIERKVENRLSLLLLSDLRSSDHLQLIKSRLASKLQESGFVLESLRVVPSSQKGVR